MSYVGIVTAAFLVGLTACTPINKATRPAPATSPATSPATQVRTAPPRPANAPPPAVERWFELNRMLADQLAPAKKDCRKVATAVREFTARHKAELRTSHEALVAWENTATRSAVMNFHARARPHVDRRIDAAIQCDNDSGARNAFDAWMKAVGVDDR
jgi:hypothetical protein